ncbi:helix-turn-helix domain-containing protein [Psychrobacillus soli]|uniref:Helix-turn-helix transcriptional regulator n=1 Tax=Psychrobacillus soli TaxID=1543965 RepID=A0A544TB87_9BACI|nr:helix-turn-helix domain-containing protein [Psychrobacillus soli]TQR14740.1 helix-turn-helix transcriptional regulator [Psychrobacillus soli]
MQSRKLKRVVIREELVVLLGNTYQAILFGQLLYWQNRTKDIDRYIEEENNRKTATGINTTHSSTFGWIYKTAKDLAEEVMLGVSENTIRSYLKALVEKKYLEQRRNPKYKWDKTYQYRVNLIKVMNDLEELGYPLEGDELSKRYEKRKVSNRNKEDLNLNICDSNKPKIASNHTDYEAISEISSKTNSEITTENSSLSKQSDEDEGFNNQTNQSFETISNTYLKHSQRNTLTQSDKEAIMDVVKRNWPMHQVVKWINECYQKFQPRHQRDQIRSFQYIANYIFDQATIVKQQQEDKLNGQNSTHTQEHTGDEYFERFRKTQNTDWENDCDF